MREPVLARLALFLCAGLLCAGQTVASETSEGGLSYGALVMAGGRYDNLRMCVGSDAGVKGGPMADIQLVAKYALSSRRAIAFHLPVMRPILFGAAFDMLQFEPEVAYEHQIPLSGGRSLVTGPGLGVSLHYGPDYESDLDNRGDEFFAAGPYISCLLALASESGNTLGLRGIYVPLFSDEHSTGTVLGAALELAVLF